MHNGGCLSTCHSGALLNYQVCCRVLAFNLESATTYCLSGIQDGMSKWKTSLPHFAREGKGLDSFGHKLLYPLTASKIHRLCNVADWQYGGQFQGTGSGCNFSCSIMLANLHMVEELRGHLPRHMKLQMDNCAKDNKNSTVLGFCALLVAEGIVETVEVIIVAVNMLLTASAIDLSTQKCT